MYSLVHSKKPHPSRRGVAARLGAVWLATLLLTSAPQNLNAANAAPQWEPCGWGGGGWYWSAVYHPTKDGVIYMGEDVGGVAKTTDHGMTWRMMNNGLTNYGVYSMAVDRSHPETVYAVTEDGLNKSIDGGEHWQFLPKTGRKDLRITAERFQSVRALAVDPTNGNNLYAASPGGKIYKSIDGGQTWATAYEKKNTEDASDVLAIQFGKVNGAYFGNIGFQTTVPVGVKPEECVGFGFGFKGDKSSPKQCVIMLTLTDGAMYRSKNLNELFKDDQWRDVILNAQDFVVDPDYAKRAPEKAKTLPAIPDWSSIKKVDFAVSGNLPAEASQVKLRKFFFAVTQTPDGQTGTAEKPILLTARDFATDKTVQALGNIHLGGALPGPAHAVAVAAKKPNLVVAAMNDAGLVLSEDAGQTWRELKTPKRASSAVFCETDPSIMYGSFYKDGIWKSIDTGKTWVCVSGTFIGKSSIREVAVSPANPLDVYAVGGEGNVGAYASNDGGKTWKKSGRMNVDLQGDPTRHFGGTNPTADMADLENIAINPTNPKEVFIAANWRSPWSGDSGATWSERNRGADISCITDIRFSKGRVYTTAMDEGAFVSENNGKDWRQLWPLYFIPNLSGHYWRVVVNNLNGVDRIITTMTPWTTPQRRVVYSEDGGKTFKNTISGLPDYIVTPNTMWGQGSPRALAVDPNDPKIVYLGYDGDAVAGKSGGGIFKSEDGGVNWKQLPNQPGSRRMFYGLAVDPTDSKRIFWGACAVGGGLYRTEDGGATWTNVFKTQEWIFNVMVGKTGVVYCPGTQLWRSTDHGTTWTQLTHFDDKRVICAVEEDPRDPKTMWIAQTTWDGSSNGAVYKTTDNGVTWQDITGNLPYPKPEILRFNPETNELWAGWIGLYKIKQ